MKNNVQNYRNILNDTRDLSQNKKIELEYDNVTSGITLESFKRQFLSWKKNNKVEPAKKARINPKAIANAFEDIINELIPDSNPLGLPDSKEKNTAHTNSQLTTMISYFSPTFTYHITTSLPSQQRSSTDSKTRSIRSTSTGTSSTSMRSVGSKKTRARETSLLKSIWQGSSSTRCGSCSLLKQYTSRQEITTSAGTTI